MQTVNAKELSTFAMIAGNEQKYTRVVDNGMVKNWVGFGWVEEGKATQENIEKYPTVVRENENAGR